MLFLLTHIWWPTSCAWWPLVVSSHLFTWCYFLEIMPAQIWGEFPPEVVWICFCQKISGPNDPGLLYPQWESWINMRASGSLSPLFAAGRQGNISFSIYTVPLTLSLLSTLVSVLGCLFSREKKSLRHLLHYIMSTFRKLYLYPGSSCFLKRNVSCHFARNRNHICPSELLLLNLYTHWTIILLHAKLCIYLYINKMYPVFKDINSFSIIWQVIRER